MARGDSVSSMLASICMLASCILAGQIDCRPENYWTLLILSAIVATVIALSSVMNIDFFTSGVLGAIVATTHIMVAGAFAWEILYVRLNNICSSRTFFDGHLKYQLLQLLNIIGLVAMVRVHIGARL